jgi:membrane fusion protein, macrolide-specific efflux system
MQMWQRPVFLVNAALGLAVLAGGFWGYQTVKGPAAAAAATTTGNRLVAVSQGEVTATATATGSVASAATATANFRTSGTVTSISVTAGDTVAKGQVLAKIDPTAAQAALDLAEDNLEAAQAALDRAEDATDPDDTTIANAKADVTTAQSDVDDAQRSVAGTVLKAPMAGTVTAVNGTLGGSSGGSGGSGGSGSTGSSSSSSGFVAIADVKKLQVSASFAESDATRIKAGQTVTITWSALTDTRVTGKIKTISPTATTSNNVNSYAAIISLEEVPSGARIGQTVSAVVAISDVQNGLRVPASAVRTIGSQHAVTVSTNGTTESRTVEIGVQGDSFTEITSGLQAGEQVVVVTQTSSGGSTNQFPGGGAFPGGAGGDIPGGGSVPGGAGGGGR